MKSRVESFLRLAPIAAGVLIFGCTSTLEPGVGPQAEEVLEGKVGSVGAFTGSPVVRRIADLESGQDSVDIRSSGEGWAVMNLITFHGELGKGRLVPGARLAISDADVDMLGCAGEVDEEWDWVEPPCGGEIVIEEGPEPDVYAISFDAAYGCGYDECESDEECGESLLCLDGGRDRQAHCLQLVRAVSKGDEEARRRGARAFGSEHPLRRAFLGLRPDRHHLEMV